ncbi:MAG: ATP-binding cassette domain-containing protein, partial [Treponema sp.]|nr:ATP-binding cassette domain-containing protein [Treponema sp.]
MEAQKPLLEARGLSVGIRRGLKYLPILEDLSFTVNSGEIVALVGESGCGKTIASLSIARLLPKAAQISAGQVLFRADAEGEPVDLLALAEDEMRKIRGKKIAMIFQEPRQSLNPLMRVGAQIAEALELHAEKPRAKNEREDARTQTLELLRRL